MGREMEESPESPSDDDWLRVHSSDLVDLIAEEAGRALEEEEEKKDAGGVGAHPADVVIRCQEGRTLRAHRLVLAATSPFLKKILLCSIGNSGDAEATSLFLPDISVDLAALLLEVIYSGSVEACLGELRDLILLARALRVDIPVSEDLLDLLEIPPPESAQHEEEEEEEEEEDKKSSPPPAKSTGLGENHLPLPPPLKRIKEEVGKRNSPPPPPSSSSSSSDPLGYQDPLYQHPALQPGVKGGVGVGGYLCPFCNSKYDNAVAFKNHLKFHESEALKEQRTQMMNEMVATCFSVETNLYTCAICHSTYSHPGNFKQHLGKHERETGAITVYFQREDPENAHLYAAPEEASSSVPPSRTGKRRRLAQGDANSHLNDALRSSLADGKDGGGRVASASSSSSSSATSQHHFCDVCGRVFKHSGNYKQHIASHMRVSSIAFPSHLRSALDGSSSSANGGGGTYKCQRCDLKLENGESLRQHMQAAHGRGNHLCRICDKVFETAAALLEHKSGTHYTEASSASQGDLFHCDVPTCLQSFSKESWLARHKRRDHSSRPSQDGVPAQQRRRAPPSFTCPVCRKTFLRMSKLNAHMKIHRTTEAHYRYPCDVCGKKFTRPQHVTRHMLLHTGVKPFRCDKCQKAFTREDKLRDHQTRGCDVLDGMELVGAQVETEEEYGDYNEEPDFTDGITAAAALGEMEEGGEVEDEDSGNEYGTMEGLMIA